VLRDIAVEWVLVEERNKVRNENLTYFIKGYVDRENLIIRLEELGIVREAADLLVDYAEERRDRETVEKKIDIYEAAYRKDSIDITVLGTKLNALELQPWRVELILELEKAKKGETITI